MTVEPEVTGPDVLPEATGGTTEVTVVVGTIEVLMLGSGAVLPVGTVSGSELVATVKP